MCFDKKGEKELHLPENLPSADFNITHSLLLHFFFFSLLTLSLFSLCVCVEKKRETPTTLSDDGSILVVVLHIN